MVEILAKYPDFMVDVMMADELGIIEDDESPVRNGLVTFGAFVVFGFVLLLVFVVQRFVELDIDSMFWACALTGATLFGLGVTKGKFSSVTWWKSGLEMMFLGGLAAVAAFYIGKALESLA